MYLEIVFFAYILDRVFGEFDFIKSYKHPVVFMGDFINLFEKYFYKDSIYRGFILTLSLLLVVFFITYFIETNISNIFVLSLLGSMGLSSKMLYDSVNDIIENPPNIKYLVSRDTDNLSQSDINKAAIETYAENLSDGVIAPLFYLLFFGIVGIFIYKAINTLDSMVGYRNDRYENFGKASAKLDDIVNYIPSRITAILITILFFSKKAFLKTITYAKGHQSPNAGYPISAMGLAIDVKLGGDTSYFGKIKKKSYFGDGKVEISSQDIINCLQFRSRFDIVFILVSIGVILC